MRAKRPSSWPNGSASKRIAPWKADGSDLEAAGVRLGTDYPHPVVDHATARERALTRFQEASPRS